MEGMGAFGLVVNVIQLVDFSSKLLSAGKEIYKSADGQLTEHTELQTVTQNLYRLASAVDVSFRDQNCKNVLTDNEREEQRIAKDSKRIATELLGALEKLKVQGSNGKLNSLRQAILTVWHKDKVEDLEGRLNRLRQDLVVNTLATLREQAEATKKQQSSILQHVDNLEGHTQTIGEASLQHIDESRRWHSDLIRAIYAKNSRNENHQYVTKSFKDESKGNNPTAREFEIKSSWELLNCLRFRDMKDRGQRIAEAHAQTFEWIYRNPHAEGKPWTSFVDWLDHGEGIYWITGKAGSGKSTLMKYLYGNECTFAHLRTWASTLPLATGAFFFWNSGTPLQMSQIGLLRTLLFEALSQNPRLTPQIFPERWEVHCLFGDDTTPWSWLELVRALKSLIRQQSIRLCFFTDGLDEFNGDHTELIELLQDIAGSPNVKLCVSSRPWVVFEDAFKSRPNLMLQDLTLGDIQMFVDNKFRGHAGFMELEQREPKYAADLLAQVTAKASGVFLWVRLVAQSLLLGLTNGDRISDLQRRLDQLPPDLEELFRKMLDTMDDFYLEHASQLFQIHRAALIPPTLLCFSMADDEADRVFETEVRPLTSSEKISRASNISRRLNSCCKGLLESPHVITTDQTANYEVQYLHRTVKEFFEKPDVWNWLVGVTKDPFNPYLSLCQSFILQLKALPADTLKPNILWDYITWCIEYAGLAEEHLGGVPVPLLDELDQAATQIVMRQCEIPPISTTFLDFCNISTSVWDPHWTNTRFTWISHVPFLHLAAVCDLHEYLKAKLTEADLHTPAGHTPLLYSTVVDFKALTHYADKRYCSRSHPRVKTIKLLLDSGADPFQVYRGSSPAFYAAQAASTVTDIESRKSWMEIVELFNLYGKSKGLAPNASQDLLLTEGHGQANKIDSNTISGALDASVRVSLPPPSKMPSLGGLESITVPASRKKHLSWGKRLFANWRANTSK